MKTIFLSTILAAFFFATNLMASNPNTITYINEETTEAGCIKEYIVYDKENSVALSKNVYVYTPEGNLVSKTVYQWNSWTTWNAVAKYEYQYNDENQVSYMTYLKWDNKENNWTDKPEQFIHIYDNDGNLTAVNKTETPVNPGFVAQK